MFCSLPTNMCDDIMCITACISRVVSITTNVLRYRNMYRSEPVSCCDEVNA